MGPPVLLEVPWIFLPPSIAQHCRIPRARHGQLVTVMNVYYPNLIMCCFGLDSNRNHRGSLLMQMDFDRGLDCLWGISTGG